MTLRQKLLVTGREGQVACSLIERAALRDDFEVIAIGRPQLDLSQPRSLASAVRDARPDIIVSAAAYTMVDQAETEEDIAGIVNGEAPGVIATVAAELGIPIIHLSTDYVFNGEKPFAYVESDVVAPVSAYGRTKLQGERAVAAAGDNHAILRTAWVHSPFGRNFLKTMMRLAETRDTVNVVDDQFGTPTSALDIADGILKVASNLLESGAPELRGIFHMTNAGRASWADFAEEIFKVSASLDGPFARVGRIPARDYPTPARRPANSELDCRRLAAVHTVFLPDWRQATRVVVERLSQERAASI